MKKTIRLITLFVLISVLLLTTSAIAADATEINDSANMSPEERLIGTWRWESQHSWIVVFREDGTMLDGPPGIRTTYNWRIIGGRLYVDGVDWDLNFIDENSITMRRDGVTYLYFWYSDSTEGETSVWIIWVILGVILLVIAGIVVIIVLVATRASRRKQQRMMQQSANYYNPQNQYNPYNYNQQSYDQQGQYGSQYNNQQSQYDPQNYNQQSQYNPQDLRCTSCGSPLAHNNKFCESCGAAQ